MTIGLDRSKRGTNLRGYELTGYYHHESQSYYWQVMDEEKTVSWLKTSTKPNVIDYQATIEG